MLEIWDFTCEKIMIFGEFVCILEYFANTFLDIKGLTE